MKVITLKEAIKIMDSKKPTGILKYDGKVIGEFRDKFLSYYAKDAKQMIEDYQKIFKHDRVTWKSRPYKK